jgi:hypothetical protein
MLTIHFSSLRLHLLIRTHEGAGRRPPWCCKLFGQSLFAYLRPSYLLCIFTQGASVLAGEDADGLRRRASALPVPGGLLKHMRTPRCGESTGHGFCVQAAVGLPALVASDPPLSALLRRGRSVVDEARAAGCGGERARGGGGTRRRQRAAATARLTGREASRATTRARGASPARTWAARRASTKSSRGLCAAAGERRRPPPA